MEAAAAPSNFLRIGEGAPWPPVAPVMSFIRGLLPADLFLTILVRLAAFALHSAAVADAPFAKGQDNL